MFKGYRELSDRERLILVQLPVGRRQDSIDEFVDFECPLEMETSIQKNSGLSKKDFRTVVNGLIEKGLIERQLATFSVVTGKLRNRVIPVRAYGLCRTRKSIKKIRKLFL
jgi:hypothetical protein